MTDTIRRDGALLAEFAASGRQAAFEEIVRRHGPLVLGACTRLLGAGADAEDAAQAVFLVLARKARSLRAEGSLAGWLHRVARHVALRAREAAAVRKAREQEAGEMIERSRSGEDLWAGLRPELDRALDGLPELYRVPLILHHLEGRTQEEAAALLGVRTGTLSARLARAREMLRERLGSRGAVCSTTLLVGLLPERALAALPGSFAASTAKAAALAAAGKAAAAGLVSAQAAALTEGVLKAMFWIKVKLVAGIVIAVAVVGAGVPVAVHAVRAGEEAKPAPAEAGKKPLTDEEMAKLAEEAARKDKFVSIGPLVSKNPHLGGETAIANPLNKHRFWCVLQAQGLAVPRRAYLCVDRTGQVHYPFKAEGFAKLLAAEDTSKWKDEDFLAAAQLYVHLTSCANQDGWKLCKVAADFLGITFNMPGAGTPGAEKREKLAETIAAPKVDRAGEKVTVSFFAWHLIGGRLLHWTVEFGPESKASSNELGRFGGGGYD